MILAAEHDNFGQKSCRFGELCDSWLSTSACMTMDFFPQNITALISPIISPSMLQGSALYEIFGHSPSCLFPLWTENSLELSDCIYPDPGTQDKKPSKHGCHFQSISPAFWSLTLIVALSQVFEMKPSSAFSLGMRFALCHFHALRRLLSTEWQDFASLFWISRLYEKSHTFNYEPVVPWAKIANSGSSQLPLLGITHQMGLLPIILDLALYMQQW